MQFSESFIYDESSPTCLRWRRDSSWRTKAGDVAGGNGGDGYKMVRMNGRKYPCHRIVWQLFNGPLDDNIKIDHKNGVRTDNRIDNLRLASNSQNGANSRKMKEGTSKYKGVSFHKRIKQWCARITVNRNILNLGYFDSEIEASEVYDYAAIHYFGEFAKTNHEDSRRKYSEHLSSLYG